ncbi:MAG: hypothetical protein EP323_00120 [Gammaproteobacteria bacterium]|nr:MAG: hypothetical protein EP323_00120 [Gammaproteobacteria bacterium]
MNKSTFYIQEAISQANYALLSFEQYQGAYDQGDTKLVFYHLHHFVLHVTNIDKVLFPSRNTFRDNILNSVQHSAELDLKDIRRLRNHLEHFDERLDRYVKNYHGQAFFDNNLVTGTHGFPEEDYLRALDGNTYKFYGEDFELNDIRSCLTPLIATLTKFIENE